MLRSYGLCSFTDHPLQEGRLQLSVIWGNDNEEVVLVIVYELVLRLDNTNPRTTVVIAPENHPNNFKRYMLLVQYIDEDMMDEITLIGMVQLPPFHPRFMFNGSGIDGINNHTTQGSHPLFHILREDKVSGNVDKFDSNAGRVWRRNVDLLGRMKGWYGREGAVQAIEGGVGGGQGTP